MPYIPNRYEGRRTAKPLYSRVAVDGPINLDVAAARRAVAVAGRTDHPGIYIYDRAGDLGEVVRSPKTAFVSSYPGPYGGGDTVLVAFGATAAECAANTLAALDAAHAAQPTGKPTLVAAYNPASRSLAALFPSSRPGPARPDRGWWLAHFWMPLGEATVLTVVTAIVIATIGGSTLGWPAAINTVFGIGALTGSATFTLADLLFPHGGRR